MCVKTSLTTDPHSSPSSYPGYWVASSWWNVFLRGNKNQASIWKSSSVCCHLEHDGLCGWREERRNTCVHPFCAHLNYKWWRVLSLSIPNAHPIVLPLKVPILIQVRTQGIFYFLCVNMLLFLLSIISSQWQSIDICAVCYRAAADS